MSAILQRLRFFSRDASNIIRFGVNAPRSAQRINVDPCEVEKWISWRMSFNRSHTGRVIGGDWDKQAKTIWKCRKFAIAKRKYMKAISWEEAGAYKRMLREIERRPGVDGCYTTSDIVGRYQQLDMIFEQMKSDGRLRTRQEILDSNFREYGGIFIHIGRKGEPIFGDGGVHRLVMAQHLGFSTIPCQLGVVHPDAIGSNSFDLFVDKSTRQ